MHLLVVGANGLLGSNLVAIGLERDWQVTGTYHTEPTSLDIDQIQLDITDHDRVRDICASREPTTVINCAAMTDVDQCEKSPERAQAINGTAPGVLATAADQVEASFVQVSTDYVFDGRSGRPYVETATPNPVQVYGETKLAGERAVQSAPGASLIARLSFVYGRHRSTEALTGFPAWVDQRLANGRETSLFTDQHVTPTRAGFAADLLLMPAYQRTDGVLNIACRSCVTPHEMGRIIAKEQGHDEQLLSQSRLRTLDRPAERPKYSCLATERLAELLEQPVPDIASELPLVL